MHRLHADGRGPAAVACLSPLVGISLSDAPGAHLLASFLRVDSSAVIGLRLLYTLTFTGALFGWPRYGMNLGVTNRSVNKKAGPVSTMDGCLRAC